MANDRVDANNEVINDPRDGRFLRTDHPRVLPLPLVHSFRCTLTDSFLGLDGTSNCFHHIPQLNLGSAVSACLRLLAFFNGTRSLGSTGD